MKMKDPRILVDPQDAHLLSDHHWWVNSGGYVVRQKKSGRKTVTIFLHRVIATPEPGQVVDHIDGNKMDNRRQNLRCCSQGQNCINTRRRPPKSGHRGISWHKRDKRWAVTINHEWVGSFLTIEDAIVARQKAVEEKHGEFAPKTIPGVA